MASPSPVLPLPASLTPPSLPSTPVAAETSPAANKKGTKISKKRGRPPGATKTAKTASKAASKRSSKADGEASRRAIWSPASDKKLFDFLETQCGLGLQTDNGNFKQSVWKECERIMLGNEEETGGAPKLADSCSNRFKTIKAEWKKFNQLAENSGWGWNYSTDSPKASDEQWDTYCERHTWAEKFRGKTFPLYRAGLLIFNGKLANGESAFEAGRSSASLDGDEDESDHSVISGWEEEEVEEKEEEPEIQVVTMTKKRKISALDSSMSKATPKRSRQSVTQGLFAMTDAVNNLAEGMNENGHNPLATPRRRKRAAEIITNETRLDITKKVALFQRVSDHIAFADLVISLDEIPGSQEIKIQYLEAEYNCMVHN